MEKINSTTKSISELTDLLCGYHNMTDRKNELLRKAVRHIKSVKEVAVGLENMSLDESRETAIQMCKMAGRTLRVLSYIWVDLDDEANLDTPNKAPEPMIDELDALEEDLPFVTPNDKEGN